MEPAGRVEESARDAHVTVVIAASVNDSGAIQSSGTIVDANPPGET